MVNAVLSRLGVPVGSSIHFLIQGQCAEYLSHKLAIRALLNQALIDDSQKRDFDGVFKKGDARPQNPYRQRYHKLCGRKRLALLFVVRWLKDLGIREIL